MTENDQGKAEQTPGPQGRYDDYMAERNKLLDAEIDAAKSFDKYLVALSGGALGLSLTFMEKIAPHPAHAITLCVAWFALTASLLCVLLACMASQKAFRRQQRLARIHYGYAPDETDRSNHWATVTTYLNSAAAALLIVGVIFLVIFAGGNLPRQP